MTNQVKDLLTGCTGIALNTAATNWASEVETVVSIVCSLAIAVVTCAVQVYRIWRDKDKDKEQKDKKEGE